RSHGLAGLLGLLRLAGLVHGDRDRLLAAFDLLAGSALQRAPLVLVHDLLEKHRKAERDEADDNETAFLNARRRCGESRTCIEQSYRNRIQELTQSSPEEEHDQPGRPSAKAKRAERRNGSREEGQRSEEHQTPPSDTHPAT